MKKWMAFVLILACLLTLGACNIKEDEVQLYFIAKVVEVTDTTMLIEVTNTGNSMVEIGSQIHVSTEKIAGVLADDPTTVTDNYVRIEYDGTVMETYPLQLGEIFKIDITNEQGISIE